MSAAAAAPAGDAAPKKGKKKMIIIVLVVVVVLALAAVGGLLFLKKQQDARDAELDGEDSAHVEKKPKKEKKKEDPHAVPVFVPLEPFVVNLADRETDRFAQVGITLQVEDAHAGDSLKAYLPAIRNNILLLLAHKTSAELMTAEGKEKLARQVLRVSVQPMHIELEDEDNPEPEDKGGKKKGPRYDSIDDSPVKSVQFSSFIIQ
jgi:flagellar protein FliL